jgi:hypothetical protein
MAWSFFIVIISLKCVDIFPIISFGNKLRESETLNVLCAFTKCDLNTIIETDNRVNI